jgi:hypothetical protein
MDKLETMHPLERAGHMPAGLGNRMSTPPLSQRDQKFAFLEPELMAKTQDASRDQYNRTRVACKTATPSSSITVSTRTGAQAAP